MGACFADCDNNGHQNLHVSDMFGKAGRRILSSFDGIDPNYLHSVKGNVLYKRPDSKNFERVSGLEPPSLFVAEAGWSWGGQYVDFDGDLDIDALGGYFTAPGIDSRLQAGDRIINGKLVVHSLSGNGRNRLFLDENSGEHFRDHSALAGLDSDSDSRGFALLDYDRDGWQDIALVNAHNPLSQLFDNELGDFPQIKAR